MPGLIPTNPTPAERTHLLTLCPAQAQLDAAARGEMLARLDRCETETDLVDTFANAVIEEGGSWQPAQGPTDENGAPRSRRTNHVHEVSLHGAFGMGATIASAIASWCKSARRLGVA